MSEELLSKMIAILGVYVWGYYRYFEQSGILILIKSLVFLDDLRQ